MDSRTLSLNMRSIWQLANDICACGCDPTVEGECKCALPVVIDCHGSNIIERRSLVGLVNGGLSDYVKTKGAELIVVL